MVPFSAVTIADMPSRGVMNSSAPSVLMVGQVTVGDGVDVRDEHTYRSCQEVRSKRREAADYDEPDEQDAHVPTEHIGKFRLGHLRAVGQLCDHTHVRCIVAVRHLDEEVPDQLTGGGALHLKGGLLLVCLPGKDQPVGIVGVGLAADQRAKAVVEPDLIDVRVQVHKLLRSIPVFEHRAPLLEIWIRKPEFEEVTAIGRRHIRIFPDLAGGDLRHDPIRREGLFEPDLRYPIIEVRDRRKVVSEFRGVGGILDDA